MNRSKSELARQHNVRNHWSVSTNFVHFVTLSIQDNLVYRRYRMCPVLIHFA